MAGQLANWRLANWPEKDACRGLSIQARWSSSFALMFGGL